MSATWLKTQGGKLVNLDQFRQMRVDRQGDKFCIIAVDGNDEVVELARFESKEEAEKALIRISNYLPHVSNAVYIPDPPEESPE